MIIYIYFFGRFEIGKSSGGAQNVKIVFKAKCTEEVFF